MGKTPIEWTDATWNPVRGCSRVSEGCRNCYAERSAIRQKNGRYSGFITKLNGHPAWTGRVELIASKLDEPLHWRAPRRIFVNSMSDLFHEALPAEDIAEVFRVMHRANWHTYQILTKRAARLAEIMPRIVATFGVMPHVWIGVSVEDQKTADERIPYLLQTPAAVRFVSYEPALGPVDFRRFLVPRSVRDGYAEVRRRFPSEGPMPEHLRLRNGLDWIIVGGESGPGARPFDVSSARQTIAQSKAAGVACFVKQVGRLPNGNGFPAEFDYRERDLKGGDWDEWPEDLRVREFPF